MSERSRRIDRVLPSFWELVGHLIEALGWRDFDFRDVPDETVEFLRERTFRNMLGGQRVLTKQWSEAARHIVRCLLSTDCFPMERYRQIFVEVNGPSESLEEYLIDQIVKLRDHYEFLNSRLSDPEVPRGGTRWGALRLAASELGVRCGALAALEGRIPDARLISVLSDGSRKGRLLERLFEQVAEARQTRGENLLTLEDWAGKLGADPKTVWCWLHGKQRPNRDSIGKLAKALAGELGGDRSASELSDSLRRHYAFCYLLDSVEGHVEPWQFADVLECFATAALMVAGLPCWKDGFRANGLVVTIEMRVTMQMRMVFEGLLHEGTGEVLKGLSNLLRSKPEKPHPTVEMACGVELMADDFQALSEERIFDRLCFYANSDWYVENLLRMAKPEGLSRRDLLLHFHTGFKFLPLKGPASEELHDLLFLTERLVEAQKSDELGAMELILADVPEGASNLPREFWEGVALLKKQDLPGAEQKLAAAMKVAGADLDAAVAITLRLAWCRLRNGRTTDALAILEAHVGHVSEARSGEYALLLGRTYLAAGQASMALPWLERTIACGVQVGSAYAFAAKAALESGDKRKGRAYAKQARELAGVNIPVPSRG